nr:MAG TPA: Papain fold toxin 1, glutamine deamidase [Caudoviricetes sp.]
MSKKIKIDEERYALDVAKRIGASQNRVLSIFRSVIHEASLIAELAPFDPDEPFRFDLYPVTKRRSDLLIDQLYKRVLGEVTASISYAWGRAHDKDDELERLARGSVATGLRRDEALAAFIARRDGGLNLSDRVWRSANQARQELEMAIDLGLREGQDAPALSRSVRAYLIEPERLFRRVRDVHGELHLSKRAESYHPGRGVYRSSYKNALRLTATETNIAYRTADYERVQELDFVRGVRVNLSKNHTLNGKPFRCICDEFAGDYPKDFKFVGWHPLCRCYTTTILAEDPDNPEKTPAVKVVPAGMREWIASNNDKVKTLLAQGKPAYWLRDNPRWTGIALKGKLSAPTAEERRAKTLERAKARHEARRSFDRRLILHQWEERQIVRRYADELPESLDEKTRLAIARNSREIERALGVTKGRPMSIDEADRQSANPRYTPRYIRDENGRYKDSWGRKLSLNPEYNERKAKPYSINCATCTPAYLLRTRGLPVVAKGNTRGSLVEAVMKGGWMRLFTNTDGSPIEIQSTQKWAETKKYKAMTPNRYKEFFEESCKEPGIYYLGISWRRRGAHATILQRTEDGRLLYVEPQADNSDKDRTSLLSLLQGGTTRLSPYDGIFRIDDKLFNLEYVSIFAKETD